MCGWNCVSCIDIWCDCVFVHARRTPVRGSCDRVSNNLFFRDTSRQKGFYWGGLCRAVTEAHKEENKDLMQLPNVNFTFFCVISLPVSPLPSFLLSSLSSFSSSFQWKILGYATNPFLSLSVSFFLKSPCKTCKYICKINRKWFWLNLSITVVDIETIFWNPLTQFVNKFVYILF